MVYRLYRSTKLPQLERAMEEKLRTSGKKAYLASRMDGMSAEWYLILAKSKKEIEDRYPGLDVFEDKPDWMNENQKREMIKDLLIAYSVFDIEEEPKGLSKLMLGKSLKEAESSRSAD
jgi:hypothetical protein